MDDSMNNDMTTMDGTVTTPSQSPQHQDVLSVPTVVVPISSSAPISSSPSLTTPPNEGTSIEKRFRSQLSVLSDGDQESETSADDSGGIVSDGPPMNTSRTTNSVTTEEPYNTIASDYSRKTSITFGGQGALPALPIPSLEETLNKLLKCLEALQEDDTERKEEAKNSVLEFLAGDGPKLQQLLLEYDREGRACGEIGSYVEEFWNDAYLTPDASVVLNLNPFFVLEGAADPKIASGDPIRRASSLCYASVKLASALRNEKFKPDTFRGKPLCMDQFRALFGASRVPKKHSKDTIAVYEKSNHVAVMCRNQLYYFQALWPDGDVAVDEGDLFDILKAIHSHAVRIPSYSSSFSAVGVLTSLSRKEWAIAREEMIDHSPVKNTESLTIVDSALFVLVLDDYIPKSKHDAAANMLHGSYELSRAPSEGSFMEYQTGSCTNRWYDKLQIIVCGDGTAGINFEHSAIDGHTALRFVSDIYADTVISFAKSITKLVHAHDIIPDVIVAKVKRAAVTLDNQGRTTLDVFPKKINFDIPDPVKRKIYFAETALGDQIVASEVYVLEFKDYGKTFITSNKMSPDAYVQMSMMLAYYQLYGKVVCAYEPVLTKSFYHGRTEAMRQATMEAKHLCEVFCDPTTGPEEKLAALRNATWVHSELVKECAKGKGVDRHLFALKCIAEKNGLPVPAFFNSNQWKTLNHTILSTSNCGNPSLALFGFGPVVPDGLGIGYIIKDTCLHYSISSKHRQTTRYALTLEATLQEMANLLEPTDTTHVREPDTHRPSLKAIPFNGISYDSYGDIWGESTPPRKQNIVNDRYSSDDVIPLKIPVLDLDVVDKPSGKAMERRWSAEIKPLGEEELRQLLLLEDESDDVCVGKVGTPKNTARGNVGTRNGGVGSFEMSAGQFKRRGSNDMLPVKPNRRDSMFGGAQRKTNLEYAALSKKGDTIALEKAD
jgi:carnitine O-acetyltransferase